MLGSAAHSFDMVQFLPSASRGAGAANGSYIAVSKYEGNIAFFVDVGAVTGSVIVKVQDADDGSGTNVADVAGATTASISSANQVARIVVPASSLRPFARVVATVTTGPVLCGVSLFGYPKYV